MLEVVELLLQIFFTLAPESGSLDFSGGLIVRKEKSMLAYVLHLLMIFQGLRVEMRGALDADVWFVEADDAYHIEGCRELCTACGGVVD